MTIGRLAAVNVEKNGKDFWILESAGNRVTSILW